MTQKEYRRDEVLSYLQRHGTMSVSEARETLGLNKNSFWSAVRQLRERGFYITTYRGTRLSESKCILQTRSEWESDDYFSKSRYPKLWTVWRSMRDRCQNKQHTSYQQYGGRGIKVCKEWSDHFQAFAQWACENGYNENAQYMRCTLDRIDNNGNYEPSNCRWVDMKVQSNNRRTNIRITFNGETRTLTQWAETLNIPMHTLYGRLKNGWDVEKMLTTPVRRRHDNVQGAWLAPIAE